MAKSHLNPQYMPPLENETHLETSTDEAPVEETKMEFTKAELARIRTLNDVFRQTFLGGQVLLAHGITAEYSPDEIQEILTEVRAFDAFTKDMDPYGEHEFGIFKYKSQSIYFKIDYYDKSMEWHSPDKSDPKVTKRVMTVMLPSDY